MKKIVSTFVCAACLASVTGFYVMAQGNHNGEQKQLAVDIQFSNSFGETITDAKGTTYNINYYGWISSDFEPKTYPPQYWGKFPLYFVGLPTTVTVTVSNTGPRAKTKVRIITESYVLLTDGSSGSKLMDPKIIEVELGKGETRVIDATFSIAEGNMIDSGLDRFLVKVQHVNEGGGPGNSEPALIMVKEGVFCPPKYTPKK